MRPRGAADSDAAPRDVVVRAFRFNDDNDDAVDACRWFVPLIGVDTSVESGCGGTYNRRCCFIATSVCVCVLAILRTYGQEERGMKKRHTLTRRIEVVSLRIELLHVCM